MPRILALAMSAAAVSASVMPRQPAVANNHVSFPIVERRNLPGGMVRGGSAILNSALNKRADTATLYNHTNIAYMIELDIGTPAQKVRVQIDTGSDELWVDPDCSTVSDKTSAAFCETVGRYNPAKSSTAQDADATNELAYGKGTAEIAYVYDNIVVPGTNSSVLESVAFGVATSSEDAAVPIMGVGFGYGFNLEYYNIIDELFRQDVTNSRAFSIALGTTTDSDGTDDVGDNIENGVIIFGGIDTKKFSGTLYKFDNMPPQETADGPWRYFVQLDSVGYTKPGSKSSSKIGSSSIPVVLDTGSSLSYLPANVMSSLASSLGSTVQSDGTIIVDCDLGDKGGSVDFTFGSLTVNVALNDFIWEGQGACALGAITASDDLPCLFGDTFLRSVYAVFDQDNKNIYMAKAANCGSNSQSLSAAGDFSFTGECSEVTSSSGSSSGSGSGSGSSSDSGSSKNAGVSRFGAVPTVAASLFAAVAGLMML